MRARLSEIDAMHPCTSRRRRRCRGTIPFANSICIYKISHAKCACGIVEQVHVQFSGVIMDIFFFFLLVMTCAQCNVISENGTRSENMWIDEYSQENWLKILRAREACITLRKNYLFGFFFSLELLFADSLDESVLNMQTFFDDVKIAEHNLNGKRWQR